MNWSFEISGRKFSMIHVILGIFLVGLCIISLAACASFGQWSPSAKTEITKIETAVETDWPIVVTYWTDFVKGLNEALPVIEALFPGTVKTDSLVVGAVNNANKAVTDLQKVVSGVQAGTLTQADATAAAKDAQASVVAASNLVGQALKGKVSTAPAKAAAK